VLQLDSTTRVAPGWTATVDAWHNLLLEHGTPRAGRPAIL